MLAVFIAFQDGRAADLAGSATWEADFIKSTAALATTYRAFYGVAAVLLGLALSIPLTVGGEA